MACKVHVSSSLPPLRLLVSLKDAEPTVPTESVVLLLKFVIVQLGKTVQLSIEAIGEATAWKKRRGAIRDDNIMGEF